MNGDFARVSFDPAAGYRRVLLQQGRMLLEADFNEQSAIGEHYLRCLVTDLKGRWWRVRDGFALGSIEDNDFTIAHGRAYVEGQLCENYPAPGDSAAICRFSNQPYVVAASAASVLPDQPFLIYIECWERQVGAIEVPGLREIALGGPDTSLRTQTVWQIRLRTSDDIKNAMRLVTEALQTREKASAAGEGARAHDKADKAAAAGKPEIAEETAKAESNLTRLDSALEALTAPAAAKTSAKEAAKDVTAKASTPPFDPATADALLDALDAAVPLMRAMAKSEAVNDDPCTLAVDSQYRGRENQLYRIEVHDGGAARTATFKWSRENGSVQFGIRSIERNQESGAMQIGLATMGRDARTSLSQGDWVELCGPAVELSGHPGPLVQVTGFGPAPATVSASLPKSAEADVSLYTILRRWDQSGGVTPNGVLPIVESSGWLPLERGVQVQFVPGGVYRTGDYWLVPARVASGDVDWPMTSGSNPERMALPPSGIKRYRAALGLAGKAGATWKIEVFPSSPA